MHVFRKLLVPAFLSALTLLGPAAAPAFSQTADAVSIPSRVIAHVDDTDVIKLPGNTHPLAQAKYDQGLMEPNQLLKRMILVLRRSPEQEAALAAFNERQYDPKSPDFHHWLHADEFGSLYGPSDADMAAVTSWLQNHGFQIDLVTKGRVSIQFTGTVAQVQDTFHLEMHRYLVNGVERISNDRDPSIPQALAPVVKGLISLNSFHPEHYSHPGKYVKRDLKKGTYTVLDDAPAPAVKAALEPVPYVSKESSKSPQPDYGTVANTHITEMLSPYDVATIYNILPLWNASTPINGKGVNVAIVATSDVLASDLATYRSSFGLPATTLTTVHSGTDPGISGGQGENTEDVEMVSASAPGANLILVAEDAGSTLTDLDDALATGVTYITENEIAPILTMSYGVCELNNGSANNSMFNQTFQQATTEGISPFVAAGDSGSATCANHDLTPPYGDQYGLAVSGMASNPYVTAVGGSDLAWPFSSNPYTDYWNTTTDANGASAKGYMPETAWNATCTNPLLLKYFGSNGVPEFTSSEQLCNTAINEDAGLVLVASGGGGVSTCTTPSGTTTASCSGGYAKPLWQAGSGVPSDGKRDLPDVAFFASYGFQSSTAINSSELLICQASNSPEDSCDYSDPDYIIYQENGGTSAASPLTAGIMAMVVQKTGAKQGLANPVFYQLAAKETYADCNTNTVAAGNSCVFYDTVSGTNAMNCYTGDTDCVTNTSGDQSGILSGYTAKEGYDMTTGLGTINVANLVNAWPTTATAPAITLSPTSLTFATTTVGVTTAAQTVTVKNTGTGTATLSTISFTGTAASSFLKSATTCGTTLAASASCTISVEFKPAAAGALTASLSVADNATGSPQLVTLQGTGAAATAPAITLSPTSLTFASTTVGVTTVAQTVTVKNTGTASASLTSETITGTDATSFIKSATTCTSSLAAGASCTVSVEFKPAAAGALTASLSVADNAAGSPQLVTLKGTGAATLTVTLSPTSLTFATTTVGATTAAQTVTLKNTSTSTVTLSTISLTGTDASSFVKSATTCGTTLAASATCTISVEFKPAAEGTLTASLSVADNATGSPQLVALKGTGTAPAVKLSVTSLTFASTAVGSTTAAQTVTLTNSGDATLDITSIAVTGTDASSFVLSAKTCTGTLAATDSCTFSVEFKPAAAGSLTGDISITDNAPASPQEVALTGTATSVATGVSLTPTTLTFASTPVGNTSEAQVETIKNTGTATVTLKSIAVTGTNSTSFEDLSACGTTLAANASCSVLVSFKPTATGTLKATLSITSSAATAAQLVTLTGTATAEPALKLSSTAITFPTTTHATTSEAIVVTITNSGTTTATIDEIVLGGADPTDFEELNDCGATLAAGATCSIYTSFKPAAAASYTGSVLIYDNAASSPQTITLSGKGD